MTTQKHQLDVGFRGYRRFGVDRLSSRPSTQPTIPRTRCFFPGTAPASDPASYSSRWYASITLPTDDDETVYYAAARDYAQMIRDGHPEQIPLYENNYEHPALSKLAYGLALSWLPPDEAILRQGQFLFASRIPVTGTPVPFHVLALRQVSAAALGAAVAGRYVYATAGIAAALYGAVLTVRSRSGLLPRAAILLGWGLLAMGFFVLADPYLWPSPWGRIAQSRQYSLDYTHNEVVRSAGYPFYQPLVWLAKSVMSHPRLMKQSPLALAWLIVGIVFLLLWGAKWPQYVLVVTAPVCISPAEGIRSIFYPLRQILQHPLVLHPQRHHVKRGVDHF